MNKFKRILFSLLTVLVFSTQVGALSGDPGSNSKFRSSDESNNSDENPRDILKDNLTLVQNNSVETEDADQPYMAGLFHLQLDISNSSSEEVQLEMFKLKEYEEMKVGTIRATGSPGKTHSIELISKNGAVIESRSFKLYQTTHNDVMTADGTYASSDMRKSYYETHRFNFEADYSARRIKVYEGGKQIFNLNIPEKLCKEQSQPYYCEYNNISSKVDSGENKSNIQSNKSAQEQSLRDIVEFVFSLF